MTVARRPILAIAAAPAVGAMMQADLLKGGFVPTLASSLAQADNLIHTRASWFDAILLDLDGWPADWQQFLANLRTAGRSVPVVALATKGTEAQMIKALELGANDHLCKPIRLAELIARLHAHLRAHDRSEQARFAIGPYTFHPSAKVLIDADQHRIRLTNKEVQIIKYLYHQIGSTVPRKRLLDEVWGYDNAITTHTLETYRLRRKIISGLLITEGSGYRIQQHLMPA